MSMLIVCNGGILECHSFDPQNRYSSTCAIDTLMSHTQIGRYVTYDLNCLV